MLETIKRNSIFCYKQQFLVRLILRILGKLDKEIYIRGMVYDIVICRTVYKEEVSPLREILGVVR